MSPNEAPRFFFLLCKVYFPVVWVFSFLSLEYSHLSRTLRSKMVTYYTLFASVQQQTQPVVSNPHVEAFGTDNDLSLTEKSLFALTKSYLETTSVIGLGLWFITL